jgi:hypothetical protein
MTGTRTLSFTLLIDKKNISFLVCRAVAHGYNFDAISCESCKAFFRRNALFSMVNKYSGMKFRMINFRLFRID